MRSCALFNSAVHLIHYHIQSVVYHHPALFSRFALAIDYLPSWQCFWLEQSYLDAVPWRHEVLCSTTGIWLIDKVSDCISSKIGKKRKRKERLIILTVSTDTYSNRDLRLIPAIESHTNMASSDMSYTSIKSHTELRSWELFDSALWQGTLSLVARQLFLFPGKDGSKILAIHDVILHAAIPHYQPMS